MPTPAESRPLHHRENQALSLDKFRDFPTTNRWNTDPSLLRRSDEIAMSIRQCGITVDPPNPNMSIKNDH
jgi:hypothetical protein